jgi:Zn-finger nucleic acid-binding protein
MQCPRCQAALRERERETTGGEVVVMDVCAGCGGIWLDKGELEKLSQTEARYYDRERDRRRQNDNDDDDDGGGWFGGGGRGRGRGGFLQNLFGGFGDD